MTNTEKWTDRQHQDMHMNTVTISRICVLQAKQPIHNIGLLMLSLSI